MSSNSKWFSDVVGTTRIDLPAIDAWIEVRNELTVGEEKRMYAPALTPSAEWSKPGVDLSAIGFAAAAAWLVDWSLRDQKDKPVEVSMNALQALKPAVFDAIDAAIDAHIKACREGNAQTSDVSDGAPTSPSVA